MINMETISAISTPAGQGGIAIVRISGLKAYQIVEHVFEPFDKNKKISNAKGYTASYGHFKDDEGIFDNGVALFFRAPHSYTGEDVVELSCHGGEAVSIRLLNACIKAGSNMAEAGEFTKRALLNGKLDLAQAESVMEMISATSMQGTSLARSGIAGAVARAIEPIKKDLVEVIAHISAFIDFPDEDVEPPDMQNIWLKLVNTQKNLGELLKNYEKGSILRRGVHTAIIGQPNVGKSTLFNLMSGYEKAIVTSVAGTTRDVVEEQILIGNVPLILFDTAGMHDTEDIVEAEGIRKSYEKMEQAGLIIAVFDASSSLPSNWLELAEQCKGKTSLCICNKMDLGLAFDINELTPYFTKVISLSAFDKEARETLQNAIDDILGLAQLNPDLIVISNKRQFHAASQAYQLIEEAIEAIQDEITLDAVGMLLQSAVECLNTMTGENVSELVIDEVFSTFCVGK